MAVPTSYERLRRRTLVVWTVIGFLVLSWVFLLLADSVRIIWLPLAFAGGITLLLNPMVSALERIRVPRAVGTVIAFIVSAAALAGSGFLLVPVMRQQATALAGELPDLYDAIVAWLGTVARQFGFDLGPVWTSQSIQEWIADPANQETIQEVLGGFGAGAGRVLLGVTETVAVVLLAPVLAFYMLMDATRFKQRARQLTPPRHREEITHIGRQVVTALGSFVRGQLLVAFVVGVLSSVGLYFLDLPFWLIIGIIAGILNMVPFVGPFIGGALAAVVALLNGSVSQAVWSVVLFTAIQQFDNHLVTPLVQRTRVNLSPLVIVLALIAGGAMAGILGVLVAVPAVAALRIVAGHLWRTRVLGESWLEASEAMIERTPPPERIAGIRRRPPAVNQPRLFDTAEHPQLRPEEPPA